MPDTIQLPEILDFPDKLIPIITQFNSYRYFLIEGGRNSGKSWSVHRLVIYIGNQKKCRIVFGREIQKNIEESVYTLVKDTIEKYGLDYKIGAKEIDHLTNGTEMRFRGFREQEKINIKGLEGVDILVIDESQQLTKQTIDVIIPTIRKEKAKVFFIMNRTLKDDPAYVAMVGRPDCLHIKINYHENKHCPESAKKEAMISMHRNMEDYRHIWLGEPLPQANNAVFRNVQDIVGEYAFPIEAEKGVEYVLGVDLARAIDYTVLVVLNVRHKRIDYFERMENENKTSWNYQKEKIAKVSAAYNKALVVLDSSGVGDPIVEDLQRQGVNVWHDQKSSGLEVPGLKFTSISKENIVERLKVAIEMKLIILPNIKVLIDELEAFESTLLPSRNYRYAAPEGKNDDCVIALALALWGIRSEIYNLWKPIKPLVQAEKFWLRVKEDLRENNSETSGQEIGEGRIIMDEDTVSVFDE